MLLKDGLMKCSILLPRHPYHPVVPFRCNKRLLFCLFRSRAIEQNRTEDCTHDTVAERALTGTWVLDEIRLAVKKDYKLVEVHEVYEYQVTQYNPQTGNGGFFVQYIDTFLKLMAEASGYTSWVHSPEDRFLATPGIEVATLAFVTHDVVWASWLYIAEEKLSNLRYTKEVIGAHFIAGARIHLYGYLDRLQKRALYCDTESVIYIQPTAEPPLVKTGECLGAMTSALKPGCHIEEFVSGGTKNYAYRIVDPVTGNRETVCKVTLNYRAS